jgi:hypothetical protein
MTLPVLRALAKDGPLGFVLFDAHTDLFDGYFGGVKYTHGTPFRRAVEEGLLDPARMVMIGIRGTTYDGEDRAFAAASGIRIIPIDEFRARGPEDVMAEARAILGDGPAYLSILVTAKVMGTLQLVTYEMWQPSPWVMAGTFSVGVVAMALYLLPRFKGLIVGVQWAKRMNGF